MIKFLLIYSPHKEACPKLHSYPAVGWALNPGCLTLDPPTGGPKSYCLQKSRNCGRTWKCLQETQGGSRHISRKWRGNKSSWSLGEGFTEKGQLHPAARSRRTLLLLSLELSSPSVLSSPGNTRTFLGLCLLDLNSVYVVLIIGWLTHFSFALPIILPLIQGTLVCWARYSSLYIYSDCNLQSGNCQHKSGEETEVGRLFPVPESAESNRHMSWTPLFLLLGSFQTFQWWLTSIWRGVLNPLLDSWAVAPHCPPSLWRYSMPPKLDFAVGYFMRIFLSIVKLTPAIGENVYKSEDHTYKTKLPTSRCYLH